MFGCFEMEQAAKAIVAACVKNQDNWETAITLDTFKTADEQDGFLDLLHNGWMNDRGYGSGVFYPRPSFIDKVLRRDD